MRAMLCGVVGSQKLRDGQLSARRARPAKIFQKKTKTPSKERERNKKICLQKRFRLKDSRLDDAIVYIYICVYYIDIHPQVVKILTLMKRQSRERQRG